MKVRKHIGSYPRVRNGKREKVCSHNKNVNIKNVKCGNQTSLSYFETIPNPKRVSYKKEVLHFKFAEVQKKIKHFIFSKRAFIIYEHTSIRDDKFLFTDGKWKGKYTAYTDEELIERMSALKKDRKYDIFDKKGKLLIELG